jgi:hypothetical protein
MLYKKRFNKDIFNFNIRKDNCRMTKKEMVKIFLIALITGNIMGIVLIQIFETLTLINIIILEISLLITIVLLFVASKAWNKRLEKSRHEKENN